MTRQTNTRWLFALTAFTLVGFANLTTVDAATEGLATGKRESMQLRGVVMVMRHGVRPPTKATVTPKGTNDQPWPEWSVEYGELTQHGFDAVVLLGEWDRGSWAQRGLLPVNGCPAVKDVTVAVSAKSRTQDTARGLLKGLAPGCGIKVQIPATKDDDTEFHPLDAGVVPFDADDALAAAVATEPVGGMKAEARKNAKRFALLNVALGCCSSERCETQRTTTCDISKRPLDLMRVEGDRPDVGEAFGIASTASQTFLLEYLEGKPMSQVAWGRLDRSQISELLEFHPLKFRYESRTPYVATRAASPLARRMLAALEAATPLTVLVGHDTNIADLGGFFGLHWQVPGYPRDDPPPGGALGFELVENKAGDRFVRAFYRSQTMDQVRHLEPLGSDNAPSYQYLPIPQCAEPCSLQNFSAMVGARLVASKPGATPSRKQD